MANRIDSEDERPVKKKVKRLMIVESSAEEDENDAIEISSSPSTSTYSSPSSSPSKSEPEERGEKSKKQPKTGRDENTEDSTVSVPHVLDKGTTLHWRLRKCACTAATNSGQVCEY